MIILLLSVLFVSACKKKNDDPYIRSDSVEVGDYTNMAYFVYDSVVVYKGLPAIIDLDMDHDQIADIRLISMMWGSVGLGHHPRSELHCLTNNVSVAGYLTTDTTFFSFDQSIYPGYDSMVVVDQYFRYSCHRISDHDTVVNIALNSFKVMAKRLHDRIGHQDVFKTDSITLTDESYGFPPYTIYSQDTVFHKYQLEYNDCNTFPADDVNYIGVRIMNGNEVRYGWIKLSIIDKNKIIVFETAIQK